MDTSTPKPNCSAVDQEDYDETVRAVLEGYKDVKAALTRPAEEVLEELRVKYGFPKTPPC